jgi:RIO-like serine/threonine protein kinase
MRKLTENHRRVLKALDTQSEDFSYLNFAHIARRAEIDRKLVRRNVRHLARIGLAQFASGLWTEDGEPAGGGYAITAAGLAALQPEGERSDA